MTVDRDPDYLISLVHELRKLPKETGWTEFKHNIAEADEIGECAKRVLFHANLLSKIRVKHTKYIYEPLTSRIESSLRVVSTSIAMGIDSQEETLKCLNPNLLLLLRF